MIKIIKYSKEFKLQWDEFLDISKNSTFLFKRDFMEYHSYKFEDYSIIIFEKEKIVGLLPANIVGKKVLISHQGLTYGGFVFRKDEKLNNILKYIYFTLKFFSEKGIEILKYKSFPRFYNVIGCDEVDYSLFLLGAKLYRRDTAIAISLRNRIDFQKRRERAIRKAKKLHVRIAEENSFTLFWNEVLTPNLKERFGVNPVHSLDEINFLGSHFPDNIRQFNAYLNDKIVAGTTIFETTSVAHAQYISSSEEGRKNGGIDLLFSQLIENVFSDKDYFDFGICNEEDGKRLNHGLLDWKEGFGGRAYSHDFYEIGTINYPLLEKVINW